MRRRKVGKTLLETYTTGTGQFIKVHTKQDCVGPFCCIHNPSHHHARVAHSLADGPVFDGAYMSSWDRAP